MYPTVFASRSAARFVGQDCIDFSASESTILTVASQNQGVLTLAVSLNTDLCCASEWWNISYLYEEGLYHAAGTTCLGDPLKDPASLLR